MNVNVTMGIGAQQPRVNMKRRRQYLRLNCHPATSHPEPLQPSMFPRPELDEDRWRHIPIATSSDLADDILNTALCSESEVRKAVQRYSHAVALKFCVFSLFKKC